MVSSASGRPQGRLVTLVQAIALLLAFVLVATVGGVLTAGLVMPAVATTSTVTEATVELFDDLPSELEPQPLSQQSRLYAADGSLLATFFWQNRIVVPLEAISEHMKNAVVATEDRRFFEHGGVDPAGMARALVKNATTDETQGASTLTQQYVKNVQIEDAHSRGDAEAVRAVTVAEGTAGYARKLQEAKLAIALEQRMSKDEILQGYLNIAQFGLSVYGVEAAAQHYFSISAKDLNYLQAATIAGVTQAPGDWDPIRNPEASETRRNTVLSLMRSEGYITKEEYDAGVATPLPDTLKVSSIEPGCSSAGGAAYFCDYVTDVIMRSPEFGETAADRQNLLYRGGLDIYTTLDTRLQSIADEEVRRTVPQDDESQIADALVTVEPGTGKVLAMAQNRTFNPRPNPGPGESAVNYNTDYAYGGSNGFQVGSTFKPFILAEWLRSGKSLNAVVSANKREWEGDEWTAACKGANPYFYDDEWTPANFDGDGSGSMTVLNATADSVNTAYVSMINQLDLCEVTEMAESLGVHRADGRDLTTVPSMVLGVEEVSPLTMASAYAVFASNGTYCDPVSITKVTDPAGNELPVPSANCREVLDPRVASTVTYALQEVMLTGSGRPSQLAGRPSAGKTGTTNSNWHTWFVGFTPQMVSTVWLGNPDRNESMQNIRINGTWYRQVYGGLLAAPTWDRYMTRAHEGLPVERFPEPDQRLVVGERATVPNVFGRSVSSATAILEDAGFAAQVRERRVYSSAPAGTVAGTDPGRGARIERGSTVTILISAGRAPRPPSSNNDSGGGGDNDDDGGGRGGDDDGDGNNGRGNDRRP